QRGNRVLIVAPGSTRQRAKAAPQVVIEALAEAVCERGLDALRHPTNRVRLAELNPAQRDELRQRVRVLKAISTGEKLSPTRHLMPRVRALRPSRPSMSSPAMMSRSGDWPDCRCRPTNVSASRRLKSSACGHWRSTGWCTISAGPKAPKKVKGKCSPSQILILIRRRSTVPPY